MSPPPRREMQSPSSSSPNPPTAPVATASAGFPVPPCPGAGCPVPESWCPALGSRCWVPVVPVPSVLALPRPPRARPSRCSDLRQSWDRPGRPGPVCLERRPTGCTGYGRPGAPGTSRDVAAGLCPGRAAVENGHREGPAPVAAAVSLLPSFPPSPLRAREPSRARPVHRDPPAPSGRRTGRSHRTGSSRRTRPPEHGAAPRGRTAPAARGPSPVSPPQPRSQFQS